MFSRTEDREAGHSPESFQVVGAHYQVLLSWLVACCHKIFMAILQEPWSGVPLLEIFRAATFVHHCDLDVQVKWYVAFAIAVLQSLFKLVSMSHYPRVSLIESTCRTAQKINDENSVVH